MDKLKSGTKQKSLTHIVNDKQVGITIISSLNTSQKVLVPEVLKLARLIMLVPTINAVSERSYFTLRRVKTYLRSSISQEHLISRLIFATYKEQEDELKLVGKTNQLSFENASLFHLRTDTSPESSLEASSC